jgi:RNA polymerase sigma factor (sigma-70 family)
MRTTATLASPVTAKPDFESFFRDEYAGLVRALALSTGAGQAEAEDLVQEAMARVYERWPRVVTMASPSGYAFQVARNLHRRRLRTLLRSPVKVVTDHGEDPAAIAGSREDVRRALMALPRRDREVLVMIGVLGLTNHEAAVALGTSDGALRVRLHRARAAFRNRYEVSDG